MCFYVPPTCPGPASALAAPVSTTDKPQQHVGSPALLSPGAKFTLRNVNRLPSKHATFCGPLPHPSPNLPLKLGQFNFGLGGQG